MATFGAFALEDIKAIAFFGHSQEFEKTILTAPLAFGWLIGSFRHFFDY